MMTSKYMKFILNWTNKIMKTEFRNLALFDWPSFKLYFNCELTTLSNTEFNHHQFASCLPLTQVIIKSSQKSTSIQKVNSNYYPKWFLPDPSRRRREFVKGGMCALAGEKL